MRLTLFCLPKGKKKSCLLKGKSHFSLLALLQLIICYLMQLFIWLCTEPSSLPLPLLSASDLTKSHTSSTSLSHHRFLLSPKVCPSTALFVIYHLFLLLLIQSDSNHIHLAADRLRGTRPCYNLYAARVYKKGLALVMLRVKQLPVQPAGAFHPIKTEEKNSPDRLLSFLLSILMSCACLREGRGV